MNPWKVPTTGRQEWGRKNGCERGGEPQKKEKGKIDRNRSLHPYLEVDQDEKGGMLAGWGRRCKGE